MPVVIPNKWKLPSAEDGSAFMVRSDRAEKDLRSALDLLDKVRESIPHVPASETKQLIDNFLTQFKA